MRSRIAVVVAIALTAAACGGGAAGTSTTEDTSQSAAEEYAFSARRALEETRFEGLTDAEVAGLVLDLCDDLSDSEDPDSDAIAAVAAIDAPAGEPVDDEIMAIVLAQGALAVCPGTVDEAQLRAWDAAVPEERFLSAVLAVAPELDVELAAGDLLEAGVLVCEVLDGGGTPEDAVVAEFAALFGTEGVTVEEIASGEAGEREGLLAGGVLGGAASYLCPEHHGAVLAYLEALAEENAG